MKNFLSTILLGLVFSSVNAQEQQLRSSKDISAYCELLFYAKGDGSRQEQPHSIGYSNTCHKVDSLLNSLASQKIKCDYIGSFLEERFSGVRIETSLVVITPQLAPERISAQERCTAKLEEIWSRRYATKESYSLDWVAPLITEEMSGHEDNDALNGFTHKILGINVSIFTFQDEADD